MKKKIAIAVAAVAVVLVGFLFWQTQKTDNTQNNNTNQSDANNLGNISSFSNSELGVKFLYPGDWGEIRLRPLGNSNDKNSVLYGTFESKSSITFKISGMI